MKKVFILTAFSLFLTACSAERISHFPSYKLTVQQGNEVTEQAVNILSEGMSRNQVRMLLGTPLLQDPFHSNRWDYPYVISRNGVIKENRTLSLHFDGDTLVRIEKRDNNQHGE